MVTQVSRWWDGSDSLADLPPLDPDALADGQREQVGAASRACHLPALDRLRHPIAGMGSPARRGGGGSGPLSEYGEMVEAMSEDDYQPTADPTFFEKLLIFLTVILSSLFFRRK